MTDPPAVLFEDPHVLAVDKPAGLLTQGLAAGEDTLEQAVRRYLDPGAPESVYLGTVHRLDRPVSGVVLWAKTPKAARRLAAEFAGREVFKEYWAVVEVHDAADPDPEPAAGVWDDWLTETTDGLGVVRATKPRTPGSRRAVTRFRFDRSARLADGLAWLRLYPETGRTHQLRAQAALRGLPVRGDALYGAATALATGIALHARSLRFRHPVRREFQGVVARPPADWPGQGIDLGD